MPEPLLDNCCTCAACELFVLDAGHLCLGFLPLPIWARGSWALSYGEDSTDLQVIAASFYDQTHATAIPDGRMEYGDADPVGNISVMGYNGHYGVTVDTRVLHRYHEITYTSSGYNVSGAGTVENPYVFTAWSRSSHCIVEPHSGQLSLIEMSVTVGVDTWTYSRTLNTTTGNYAESGNLNDIMNAETQMSGWPSVIAGIPGSTVAVNVSESGATLTMFIPASAWVGGTGEGAQDATWQLAVGMSQPFTIEDALAHAETMLDTVDISRIGDAAYTPTINGSAQMLKMNTRLVLGWAGWPLAIKLQSIYYSPIGTAASQNDQQLYPARRSLNWSFPGTTDEDTPQDTLNTAFAAEALPTFFFNPLLVGGGVDPSRLGVRVSKGCATTAGERVCAFTANQELPVANTATPPAADNGSDFNYDGLTDCVRDFMPNQPGDRLVVDPADLPFDWARMKLLRRCWSHSTGEGTCCDMENP